MMKYLLIISLSLFTLSVSGGGYNVGDKASDFSLKNTEGEYVSLKDYPETKGFVVIFTCNHCPFARAYEDRIIAIHNKYSLKGYPVIAINPNDPEIVPEDSYENMKIRVKEKGYTFPYLDDEKQEVFKEYGATRTPHVFVLTRKNSDLEVSYIGTIDNNYKDAEQVTKNYLSDALDALLAGKKPETEFTKAIGCTIKVK